MRRDTEEVSAVNSLGVLKVESVRKEDRPEAVLQNNETKEYRTQPHFLFTH